MHFLFATKKYGEILYLNESQIVVIRNLFTLYKAERNTEKLSVLETWSTLEYFL